MLNLTNALISFRSESLFSIFSLNYKISSYSYIKGDAVYLEEDCDAAVYLDAMKAKGNEVEFIELNEPEDYSKIRDYKSYDMINHPVQFEDVLKKEIEKRGFDTSRIEIAVIR